MCFYAPSLCNRTVLNPLSLGVIVLCKHSLLRSSTGIVLSLEDDRSPPQRSGTPFYPEDTRMPNSATPVFGFFPYIGLLIKDVGSRCAIMAHHLRDRRMMFPVTRHQNVRAYRGLLPWTHDTCFIAPSAFVVGNVVLGHNSCVYYHTVIRNYSVNTATVIGDDTVIMDRATLMGQVRVGSNAFIGCGTSLDCCDIHDHVYIGPGATIALGAVVEDHAIVAAGSVISKDIRVNAGELWAGNPAQKIAEVTPEQASEVQHLIQERIATGNAHVQAIRHQIETTKELDTEWLKETIQLIEKQQQQVIVRTPIDIPLEAMRFLQPRVHMRRPEMHMRMSYPVNRVAPWMPKAGDQVANA